MACEAGDSCHIQFLVDRDDGPGVLDFRCGTQTYDGHNGVDVRLPDFASLSDEVGVLAAADGVVLALRDGERDFAFRNGRSVEGVECGNGVVVDHGGGWQTQYCHLAEGSVRPARGDRVRAGDVLGTIGMSGKTEFPHLHFVVRHDGMIVDPFAPSATGGCTSTADTLWSAAVDVAPGGLLSIGFADRVPDYEDIQAGTAGLDALTSDLPALVVWSFFFSVQADDVVELELEGPEGPLVSRSERLERTQAQAFRAAGLRRPEEGWIEGNYAGRVRLVRGDAVIAKLEITDTLGR